MYLAKKVRTPTSTPAKHTWARHNSRNTGFRRVLSAVFGKPEGKRW